MGRTVDAIALVGQDDIPGFVDETRAAFDLVLDAGRDARRRQSVDRREEGGDMSGRNAREARRVENVGGHLYRMNMTEKTGERRQTGLVLLEARKRRRRGADMRRRLLKESL
jgi:hypothetical protein